MMTCEKLYSLIRRNERENLTIELKNSAVLKDKPSRDDLACDIVAIANRQGGKIIIGVNDDGSIEGKNIFNVDKDKGKIDNICYGQISPIIDYKLDFIECKEGDFLIINIPKRENIPHAIIKSRKGTEIESRAYYIRTKYGKRLLSDHQLQWLFNFQGNTNFTAEFKTSIIYNKNNLSVLNSGLEQPPCADSYHEIINKFAPQIIERISFKYDSLNQEKEDIFLGITPYVLIRSLSFYFSGSWIIKVHRRKPYGKSLEVQQIYTSLDKADIKHVYIDSIPKPQGHQILWQFEKNINDALASPYKHDQAFVFTVPSGTEVIVEYEKGILANKVSKLILQHQIFNFEFSFSSKGIRPGPAHGHPFWEVIMSKFDSWQEVQNSEYYKLLQSFEIDCKFKAFFNYPDNDSELFEEYYQYAQTIKDIFKYDWCYDHFLDNLPHRKLYGIENKLDLVLKELQGH